MPEHKFDSLADVSLASLVAEVRANLQSRNGLSITESVAIELLKAATPEPPAAVPPSAEMKNLAAVVMHNEWLRRKEKYAKHPRAAPPTRVPKHSKVLAALPLPPRPAMPEQPTLRQLLRLANPAETKALPRYEELQQQYQRHFQACQELLRQMGEVLEAACTVDQAQRSETFPLS